MHTGAPAGRGNSHHPLLEFRVGTVPGVRAVSSLCVQQRELGTSEVQVSASTSNTIPLAQSIGNLFLD